MKDRTPQGWYRLPKSGQPFYGPIPDGAETIDAPGDVADEGLLALSVEEIAREAVALPIDELRTLIQQESAGRNRKTALEALERLAKEAETAHLDQGS